MAIILAGMGGDACGKPPLEWRWVEKEATYAVTRRRRSDGKRPNITAQTLCGPPWVAHPSYLDSINSTISSRAREGGVDGRHLFPPESKNG